MRQLPVFTLITLGIPLFGMAGCNHATEFDSANTQAVEQEGRSQAGVNSELPAPDDPKSLAAIESSGAKLKRNAQGRVFEVSFRDTSIDNSAVDHLAGLPELRVLLLNRVRELLLLMSKVNWEGSCCAVGKPSTASQQWIGRRRPSGGLARTTE